MTFWFGVVMNPAKNLSSVRLAHYSHFSPSPALAYPLITIDRRLVEWRLRHDYPAAPPLFIPYGITARRLHLHLWWPPFCVGPDVAGTDRLPAFWLLPIPALNLYLAIDKGVSHGRRWL